VQMVSWRRGPKGVWGYDEGVGKYRKKVLSAVTRRAGGEFYTLWSLKKGGNRAARWLRVPLKT